MRYKENKAASAYQGASSTTPTTFVDSDGRLRDSNGRFVRSETQKEAFLRSIGYDKLPPGYQVDHIVPLAKGGRDTPDNMQLLIIEQHKAKTSSDGSQSKK